MKRLAVLGTAALFAAVPVSIGLVGNAGLSQAAPARPSASASATLGHHGGHHGEPGDDHGTHHGGHHGEHGDDHGND